jgi:hypothetical protein
VRYDYQSGDDFIRVPILEPGLYTVLQQPNLNELPIDSKFTTVSVKQDASVQVGLGGNRSLAIEITKEELRESLPLGTNYTQLFTDVLAPTAVQNLLRQTLGNATYNSEYGNLIFLTEAYHVALAGASSLFYNSMA